MNIKRIDPNSQAEAEVQYKHGLTFGLPMLYYCNLTSHGY